MFNNIDFLIYSNKKIKLDHLESCFNTNVKISTPIINEEYIDLNLTNYFSDQGYDIYNLSSDFYNDICTSVNINNTDLIWSMMEIYSKKNNLLYIDTNDSTYELINTTNNNYDILIFFTGLINNYSVCT